VGFIEIAHGSPVDNDYLQGVPCVHVALTFTHFLPLYLAKTVSV